MADIFEYLEFQAEMDNEPMRKAAAIALSRSEKSFSFLEKASSKDEFASRLSLVEDDLNGIIEEACEEFGYDDPAHIAKVVRGQIELLAADVETGDSYYQRRDDLPSAPADGSLSEPSPKLDPGKAGDQWHTFQSEPEVESVRHRNDRQNAQDVADYASDYNEDSPLVNRVDADTPMQPEFNVGDNTKVFPNKNQAQPVTSRRRKANEIDVLDEALKEYNVRLIDAIREKNDPFGSDKDSIEWMNSKANESLYFYVKTAVEEKNIDPSIMLKNLNDVREKHGLRPLTLDELSLNFVTPILQDMRQRGMKSEHLASRKSSDTEAEFRKCVEDCVKNGQPAEAALKHDEFAGLQETTKFNIINEYRGDKVTASKKKVRKSK